MPSPNPLLTKISSLISRKDKQKDGPTHVNPLIDVHAPTTASSIEHLPNEILEKIFIHCSSSDLAHLSYTSRHVSHTAIRVLYHNIPSRLDADKTIDLLLTLCAYATSRNHISSPDLGGEVAATHIPMHGSEIPSYIHSLSLVFTDKRISNPLSKEHSARLTQLNKIHRDRQLQHAKSISLSRSTSGRSGASSSSTHRTTPRSIILSSIPAALTNSFAMLTTSYISIVGAALSTLPNLEHLELKLQIPEGSDRHLGKLMTHPSGHEMPFQLTSFTTTLEFGKCMASFLRAQLKLKELTIMHVRTPTESFWKDDMLGKRLEGSGPSANKAFPELNTLSYSDRTPVELIQYLAKGRNIEKLKVQWTDTSSANDHLTTPTPPPNQHSPLSATTMPAFLNNVAPSIHLASGTVNPNSIARLLSVSDDPKKVLHLRCAFQRSPTGSTRPFGAPAFTTALLVGSKQLNAISGALPGLLTLALRVESMDEDFLHHLHTSLPLFNHLQKLTIIGSNACGPSKAFLDRQPLVSEKDDWDWDSWGLLEPHGSPDLVELDLTYCLSAGPVSRFTSLVNEYMVHNPTLKCVIMPAIPRPKVNSNDTHVEGSTRRPASNHQGQTSFVPRERSSGKVASTTSPGAGYWVFRRRLSSDDTLPG